MFRICFALTTLLATPAAALVVDTPRGKAMGGAVRGDPVGNSAAVANPAGMSRSFIYAAQANFARDANGNNAVGANVVDSKTRPTLAVGVAYAYRFSDEDVPVNDGHDARLAFAHAFVPQVFSLGLGLHYVNLDRGPDIDNTENVSFFTMDVGMLFSPSGSFHIGAVGYNLLKVDDPSMPLQAGGGVAYTGSYITLDADLLYDLDTKSDKQTIFAVGAEALLAGSFPVRLGFEDAGPTDVRWASGGLGFQESSFRKEGNQLNLAYRQDVKDRDVWEVSASLVMFL